MTSPSNVQATFCATLVDEWVRAGVRHAVVCPGSRSTPMALALASNPDLDVHVHHDERAGAFTALGIGLATGLPAVVLTTSGTAAVELHPAVVEASMAGVPMLVCTADRPAELQSVGAAQTIDQTHLYGRSARWFTSVSADVPPTAWRSLASRAFAEAATGPVHVNLQLREPLVGQAGELPPAREGGWHLTGRAAVEPLTLPCGRGLIVAGGGVDGAAAAALGERTGWPVLADARARTASSISAFDALLRHQPFAAAHRPDMVVRLGTPPASKALAQWLASGEAHEIVVAPAWVDPDRRAATVILADPTAWCAAASAAERHEWSASWRDADERAQRAIDEVLARQPTITEPFVARTVTASARHSLVVASSMPVRDVEWYGARRGGLRVLANRGANGIDGVVSTAVGVALTGGAVTALVGDLAFLHDANALLGLAARGVDLTIVVVDNRGGGIFSFLPQATLPSETFEMLFGTPHDVDLQALAVVHGLPTFAVHEPEGLQPALDAAASSPGAHVVVVRTDRHANVGVHDELHAAVAAAL